MTVSERTAAWVGVLPGLLLSAWLAPDDLINFLFYAGSQLAVLALAAVTLPRPAVLAGMGVVLPLYLAGFAAWLFGQPRPDALAWLGYVFTLPGGALAAIGVGLWLRGQKGMPARLAMLSAVVATIGGLALTQLGICSSVLYCLG